MSIPCSVVAAAQPAVFAAVFPAGRPPEATRFDLQVLPVFSGQCLGLRLPHGSLLVLAEGQARVQPPAGGSQPPPAGQALAEGQAWRCEQTGFWQLVVLRSGCLVVQRPRPLVQRFVHWLRRWRSPARAATALRGAA